MGRYEGHKRDKFLELLGVWDVLLVSVSQIVVVEESMWVVVSLL